MLTEHQGFLCFSLCPAVNGGCRRLGGDTARRAAKAGGKKAAGGTFRMVVSVCPGNSKSCLTETSSSELIPYLTLLACAASALTIKIVFTVNPQVLSLLPTSLPDPARGVSS